MSRKNTWERKALQKVLLNKRIVSDECWLYTGQNVRGHGIIKISGQAVMVSRASLWAFKGLRRMKDRNTPIRIRRRCAKVACFRPSHLYIEATIVSKGQPPIPLARKRCARCGSVRLAKHFNPDPRNRSGLDSYCRECSSRYVHDYYERNPNAKKDSNRRHYATVRNKVFDHYGWVCSCCGETEPFFLTTDHVNGNGGGHDRLLRGYAMYKAIIDAGFPDDFQILCFNCNCGRYRNGGTCPHKSASTSLLERKRVGARLI